MEIVGRRPRSSEAVTASKQRMMMEEINRAHQLANQLQDLLPQLLPLGSRVSELAAYHMEEMIKCYDSLLSNRQPQAALPAGASRPRPPLNTPKMKPGGDHCLPRELKIRDNSDLTREQRDHYDSNDPKKRYLLQLKKIDPSNILVKVGNLFSRRRKIQGSVSVVTAVPYDEQLWRKYGQKSIRGAKQPRSYFRCSYWKERGCQAKKTVQQDDKDETKYHVVYTKPHTCSVTAQLHSFPNYLPIESPPEISNSNNSGKCYGSSFPGEHPICPLSADQVTPPGTGDEEPMHNNAMPSSEVASSVPTPGTLEMTNNDEMFGLLPTLESDELDNDYLMTMIDECMPVIYI